MRTVDAPRLLDDFFREASGSTWVYSKTEHSVRLTEWLLKNSPGDLKEVAELIATGLGTNKN